MSQKLPSFRAILWISLVLILIGWGGLVVLLMQTLPTLAPRWLFFFLLMLALSGTALPAAYFLNRRFPSNPPVESGVVLREAMWFGVYGSLLAWLQMGRVLTSGLALVLLVGMILVELLLRMGESSSWRPARAQAGAESDDGEEDEGEDA